MAAKATALPSPSTRQEPRQPAQSQDRRRRPRYSGIEVVYEDIRLTPARLANAALEEGVHIVGFSLLSGSRMPLVKEVLRCMRESNLVDIAAAGYDRVA